MTRTRSAAVCSGVFGDQKYLNELQPAVGTPAAARPAATLLSSSAHPPSPVNSTAITSLVDGAAAGTSMSDRSDVSGIGERGVSAGRSTVVKDRYASSSCAAGIVHAPRRPAAGSEMKRADPVAAAN